MSKLHFGWEIEAEALVWYQAQVPGARLIARNYRKRVGEIDLIFEERTLQGGLELVFIEVRARLEGSWQDGVQSVGGSKHLKLRRAIDLFLAAYRGRAKGARLDILAWDGHEWEHRKNIW